MGFFGSNYNKPGPGVRKDEPKKTGIFLYTEILFRKFFKLAELNMLYILCSLPFLLLFFFVPPIAPLVESVTQKMIALNPGSDPVQIASYSNLVLRLTFSVGLFTLWGSGPASAAFSYITRCYTREEHAWILGDGRDKFKENFRQGMIVVLVDIAMIYAGAYALMFYHTLFTKTSGIGWMLAEYVAALILLIYTFMHYYLYQLMVTLKCTMIELYKNALILALGKSPMNFLLTLVVLILLYILFGVLHSYFGVLLTFVFMVAMARFPIEFYAARTLKKLTAEMNKEELS